MAIIRAVPNERLQRTLVMKVVDTAFVNPNWGMWSKTTKELEDDKKFHEFIDNLTNKLGVESGSVAFIWSLRQELKEYKKLSTKSYVSLLVVGTLFISSTALENNTAELERRMRTSPRPRGSSLFNKK